MSSAVQTAIAAATQVSVNGTTRVWDGFSASSGQQGFGVLTWTISYAGGVLCFFGDDGDNTTKLLPEPFTPAECAFPESVEETITIQSESYRTVKYFNFPWISISVTFS